MNDLFGRNFDAYILELFATIDESLQILKEDKDLEKSKKNKYYKALKYIEVFMGRTTKLQKRNFTGVESFIRIDFFFYPLSDLSDLTKQEGDRLSSFQNQIILEKAPEYKEAYQKKDQEIKKILKTLDDCGLEIE